MTAPPLRAGRGGAAVQAERALRPPGGALVPPPPQPGPAQSPQEVPRSQVGRPRHEKRGAEGGLGCPAGSGGQWLCAGWDLIQVGGTGTVLTSPKGWVLGVVGGLRPSPAHSPGRFRFLFQLEIHILPDRFHCGHGRHRGCEWGLQGRGRRFSGKVGEAVESGFLF